MKCLSIAAGSLPSDWSDLAVLQGLDLSNNNLKGELPASWGSLRDLQVRWGCCAVLCCAMLPCAVPRCSVAMHARAQQRRSRLAGSYAVVEPPPLHAMSIIQTTAAFHFLLLPPRRLWTRKATPSPAASFPVPPSLSTNF